MSDNAPNPATAPAQGGPQPLTAASRITITYPTAGNVPGGGTFPCYGKIDTISPPPFTYDAVDSAVIDPNTGQVIVVGTQVAPDPGYNFKFQFTGVPLNILYVLRVRALKNGTVVDSNSVEITCTAP